MIDLYVYYKLAPSQAAAALALLLPMQARLAANHAITPLLKRRALAIGANPDDLQTWMEVYPGVPDDFANVLAAAVDQAGFAALDAGPRHIEVFVDAAPCV
jgi:hypothetical protein